MTTASLRLYDENNLQSCKIKGGGMLIFNSISASTGFLWYPPLRTCILHTANSHLRFPSVFLPHAHKAEATSTRVFHQLVWLMTTEATASTLQSVGPFARLPHGVPESGKHVQRRWLDTHSSGTAPPQQRRVQIPGRRGASPVVSLTGDGAPLGHPPRVVGAFYTQQSTIIGSQ